MFSWRFKRQFAVFLVFAIPLVVLGFWLVPKIIPEPTCTDNVKNQGETATDCGGPCVPCELKHPKDLAVFWARVVPIRENAYDAVAFVKNNNVVLSANRIDYEFTLFDEFGPVAVKDGSAFILAEEELHIIEANIQTSREANFAEFRVKKVNWQVNETTRPNLVVERKDYGVTEENGRKSSFVEALVNNRSTLDFKGVEVNFAVLDDAGNLLGANKIVVDRLHSGERRSVRSIWPEELRGTAATIDVEPRVNLFDKNIILKPQ